MQGFKHGKGSGIERFLGDRAFFVGRNQVLGECATLVVAVKLNNYILEPADMGFGFPGKALLLGYFKVDGLFKNGVFVEVISSFDLGSYNQRKAIEIFREALIKAI